jgi:hypothetical protein
MTFREGIGHGYGIACYSYPEGRLIGRVPVEIQVAAAPCWFPDRSTRVIFPGSDGVLYRVAFDDGGPSAPDTDRPEPIAWQAPLPGANLAIRDVAWPDDPAWGGRLLVTLNFVRSDHHQRIYTSPQVWWLELNPDATAVVRAGRVTRPGLAASRDEEERCPSPAVLPGVGPVLAYLARPPQGSAWQVRVVPLASDPDTGAPVAPTGVSRTLAEGCGFVPPVFSPDGRSVYALLQPLTPGARMERFPVPVESLALAVAEATPPAARRESDL